MAAVLLAALVALAVVQMAQVLAQVQHHLELLTQAVVEAVETKHQQIVMAVLAALALSLSKYLTT